MVKVEIDNSTEQLFNSDIHEFVMGYTTETEHINPSLQLWIGEIPDYCNSLPDAFLVVEKVRSMGKLYSILNTLEGGWNLSVLQWAAAEDSWQAVVTVNNISLPRAICEAALQIVGMRTTSNQSSQLNGS